MTAPTPLTMTAQAEKHSRDAFVAARLSIPEGGDPTEDDVYFADRAALLAELDATRAKLAAAEVEQNEVRDAWSRGMKSIRETAERSGRAEQLLREAVTVLAALTRHEFQYGDDAVTDAVTLLARIREALA